MLKRVLIANRGEIAVRIIRACIDASVRTTAVYSEPDAEALHVMLADRTVCIGKAPESYLNMDNIIEAAKGTNCDGIHPGAGFLSENAEFARKCEENGIRFIGPTAEAIELMGDKAEARRTMRRVGIPVVPGSDGPVAGASEAAAIAEEIGYPVLIKAASGGGGRGLRRADNSGELLMAYREAALEAKKSFGDDRMYVEKMIENPRHIEFQILADHYGNIIHLGERNCSIQRRHQKMLEEAPDWNLDNELRDKMGRDAIRAAKAADCRNAGTVEFIVDNNNHYYFIEMNTRIQVEHPITEMVTSIDIVREQLRIASDLPLEICQEDVKIRGHAIECRICAEDITRDFVPVPGKISFIHFPDGIGVRVESALYKGCELTPFYDSLAAKVITCGSTRLEAIRRMRRALGEMIIEGIPTTLPLAQLILYDQVFLRGRYDTGYIDKNLAGLMKVYEAVRGRNK